MLILLGIAIGILFTLFVEPLIKNISDVFSCCLELAQMAIAEKVARYESSINKIRGTLPDTGDNQTRVIGFSIDQEEQEYDDDEN